MESTQLYTDDFVSTSRNIVGGHADINEYFEKRTSCPLCGCNQPHDWIALFSVQQIIWRIRVVECPFCGFCFKDWVPNKFLMLKIYSNSYTHFSPCSRSSASIEALGSRVQRLGPPHGRHLDYCCGSGGFVQAALSAGWDSYGADPFLSVSELPKNLRRRLFCADVAVPEQRASLGQYDSISVWAGMEHIPNTGEATRGLLALLKPGGKLIFNSPNAKSLIAKTNGAKWAMAQLIEHVAFWTPKAIRIFSSQESVSIETIRISGIPFPLGTCLQGIEAQGIGGLFGNVTERDAATLITINKGIGKRTGQSIRQKVQELLSKDGGQTDLANITRRFINWFRLGDHIEVVIIKR